MENDKGFPVTRLCVWEVKLRQLGMRKHLRAKDWSLVYQHVRPRLQHEGGKKLRKPTAVLINGTKKPWEDVWKEFRRNRALSQGPHRGLLPPLPPGIVIRTPSPELLESTLRMQQLDPSQSLILRLLQATLVSFQPLFRVDSQPEQSEALKYADSVYRLCLEDIPFTILLEKIPDAIQGAMPSPNIIGRLRDSPNNQIAPALNPSVDLNAPGHHTSWKAQIAGIISHLLPGSESAYLHGQDLRLNFDSHHYLCMVIYMLSNNHLHPHSHGKGVPELKTILEITFKLVSRRVLLALLQSRLQSIKAAWEKLLFGAGLFWNQEAFRLLISVGMDNDWLEEAARGHEYLYFAVQNGCADLVDTLVARGCRADSSCGYYQGLSAIVAALNNGDLDCAILMIQHCDVNREFQFASSLNKSTNFIEFIKHFDEDDADYVHCLSHFLQHGADVDHEIYAQNFGREASQYWRTSSRACSIMSSWPFSILDYVFYFHRPLFPELAAFSEAKSLFSRARALWCLEQGVDVLREYLQQDLVFSRLRKGLFSETPIAIDIDALLENNRLEVVLFEQFLLGMYTPDRKVCCMTVQGFLEVGVDLTSLSTREVLAAEMLCATACLITSGEGPDEEQGLQLLQGLLDRGFQVQARSLSAAVEKDGVARLECLAGYCSDLKKHGPRALALAVACNNSEATKLLLDGGVDPNSIVHDRYDRSDGRTYTDTILATAAMCSTLEVMKYLVQRGASPRISRQRGHPFGVLLDILEHEKAPNDLLIKVKYVVEEHITVTEPSCLSAYLLEVCLYVNDDSGLQERRKTFEYLLKQGAKLRPGSPLAQWVAAGGGHQLAREMLDSGADPNAYSSAFTCWNNTCFEERRTPLQAAAGAGDYMLVCLLLEHGADLNLPALGEGSKTALQAVCTWDPARPEERMRKEKIVKLLLDKGADVDATNSTGHTALIYASQVGDVSTAFILLKHGAKVDAKSTGNIYNWSQTALDAAAERGRLDMVEFLLNANALSSSACSDGRYYYGAIQQARLMGHFVVAELICKHAADRRRGWTVAHGQTTDTEMPGDQEDETPYEMQGIVRSRYRADIYDESRYQTEQSHSDLASSMDDSEAGFEAEEGSWTGPETTSMSWSRAIEEIEDEPSLPEVGREEYLGENNGRTADQYLWPWQPSSGQGEELYQPGGQNWDGGEHQNGEPLVSGDWIQMSSWNSLSDFASL
ncbi:ankyrin repeat-containing domain protein [Diaporthe sp. PMI_573]|nr:ankyrin repeat-containing domain protein [Diaporthaceae sp. PMI_573]